MIRACGLAKRFGERPVLRGIDLDVAAGERVAVLGANGAGKTTLFRCLLGLTAYDGRLEVDGVAPGPERADARARVGYVPQSPPVFDLTLRGFLTFFAEVRGIALAGVVDRLNSLGLDLDAAGDRPLAALSGGMLQKAYLALALAAEPAVLLLDEPTASLDPGSRREFVRHVAGIDAGATLLLASHRLEEIESIADRLVVLHAGRIAFDGSLADLWERTGADLGLWIAVGSSDGRQRARDILVGHAAVRSVRTNGTGLWIEADRTDHVELLAWTGARGIEVTEFRTRPPALEKVLDLLVTDEDVA